MFTFYLQKNKGEKKGKMLFTPFYPNPAAGRRVVFTDIVPSSPFPLPALPRHEV